MIITKLLGGLKPLPHVATALRSNKPGENHLPIYDLLNSVIHVNAIIS